MILKTALIQSSLVWGDIERNLSEFGRKVTSCEGCDMILLPEMFPAGAVMVKREPVEMKAERERIADRYEEVKRKMQAWAGKTGALVMGSTVCRENECYYNRLIAAFPDGKIGYYDKRHCFRIGGENEYFTPGQTRGLFEYKGVKVAAFICYDLRFPVWSRNVEKYDLAVYVANWPASRRQVWQTLLRARAIENQCYVAGVNCVGMDGCGLAYAGDSALIDAKGETVGAAGEGKEEILVAELDTDALGAFRKKFAVLDDRDGFELR